MVVFFGKIWVQSYEKNLKRHKFAILSVFFFGTEIDKDRPLQIELQSRKDNK